MFCRDDKKNLIKINKIKIFSNNLKTPIYIKPIYSKFLKPLQSNTHTFSSSNRINSKMQSLNI